jgi:hypothetical protein
LIEYHGDRLVPPELCVMLYQLVPKEYHVPVRFHNRRPKVYGERGYYPLGTFSWKKGGRARDYIDINLNPLYLASWRRHGSHTCVPSPYVWRELLEICLHEFGHTATKDLMLRMNQHEYHAKCGRVYEATERLANEWMERRIARIIAVDSRLGQPEHITGYLGARLAKWRAFASKQKSGREFAAYLKERRCRKTGAQLTAGNVLMELEIDSYLYTNAYAVLRQASVGVGIDYTDGAGRRHKLYTWGDLPILAQRLKEGQWVLRERCWPPTKATVEELSPREQEPEDWSDCPF